ncbi:GNAT family N-acetyltransferase [Ramlibacter sp. USB13]|uniref:GNAT family N-acetyltransferase n=1 Tax=Ramlibacter cellulosilyticus TaxID=2764187 RepID=A0A923MQY2_9BURK|nr:GNAT family N-acetyltransferase [Ramlibacter cellulosilyticus]MBC5782954.1 GNAT family N-acetyltransferase [Ramlibacter cellulosilyticus]
MSVHLPTALSGCVLRPWRPADRPNLLRLADNRRVWRNMTHTFPHPYTDADADLWLEIAANPGASLQLAVDCEGEAVGGIGAIAGEGIQVATARFGYWLGEPFWGRGIATAAATALADHIERERLFARLEAQVFAWNPASMRVLEKAGFTREAVLRCSATKDGRLIDTVLYARVFPET